MLAICIKGLDFGRSCPVLGSAGGDADDCDSSR